MINPFRKLQTKDIQLTNKSTGRCETQQDLNRKIQADMEEMDHNCDVSFKNVRTVFDALERHLGIQLNPETLNYEKAKKLKVTKTKTRRSRK